LIGLDLFTDFRWTNQTRIYK